MSSKKNCKGALYRISGKSYCIGEKKNNSKKSKKSKKSRKNKARGPVDDDYYDITQCCMCGKNINVNDKINTLIPLACLQKHGNKAHRICKKCWFKPKTGFAIEGTSHACPGCEKGLPLTRVKPKTPEFVDLTMDSD